MRVKDLFESPLPEDWDSAIFDPRVPFSRRVAYAKERAARLGQGSSRVAFEIPYQGRQTVLKVAKNAKGMAQNEVEATLLEDWYIQSMGLVIPLIDYDESSSRPTWIHTEKAEKISGAKISSFLAGADVSDVLGQLNWWRRKGRMSDFQLSRPVSDETKETELFQALEDLSGNYPAIELFDFVNPRNWGLYKGHPVIIDIGLNTEVLTKHYSR